jgi:ABC-type phosphate/phosphonate transport system substrate-binding protein
MWGEEVARQNHITAEVRSIDTTAELIKGIKLNQINFALLNTGSFIKLYQQLKPQLKPEIYAVSRTEDLYEDYLILVKKSSTIKSINDLRSKRFSYSADHILYSHYLTHLISQLTGQQPKQFFKQILQPDTASQSVLSVYFGNSDACLIPRHIFMMTATMNPALSNELAIIHSSGPIFIPAVVLAFNSVSTELQSSFGKDLLDSKNSTRGKQILDLFRIDHLVQVDVAQFQPMFAFFK